MTKKLKYHSLETKSLGEQKFEVLNLCKSQYAIKLWVIDFLAVIVNWLLHGVESTKFKQKLKIYISTEIIQKNKW